MTFKIFIMHYTPLKERFNIMNNQLKKENVSYEFIKELDREKLTEKELQIFDTQKVKLSMCSNISKHILTYQKIIISDYNYNLILEDDVIILDNFKENLNKYLYELPKDFDIFSPRDSRKPWPNTIFGKGKPADIRKAGQYTV